MIRGFLLVKNVFLSLARRQINFVLIYNQLDINEATNPLVKEEYHWNKFKKNLRHVATTLNRVIILLMKVLKVSFIEGVKHLWQLSE